MIWEQAASPPFEADQFRATVHNRTFNRICQVALINMCAHITHICCRSGTEMLYQGSQRLNVCRLTQVEHRKDGTALAGPVLVMVRLCWGALDHHCGLELKPSRRATMSVFLHGVTLMSDLSWQARCHGLRKMLLLASPAQKCPTFTRHRVSGHVRPRLCDITPRGLLQHHPR